MASTPEAALAMNSGTASGESDAGAALEQRAVLVLDRPEPAEAGPDDAADPLVVGGQLCVPSRLRGGLAAGHQRELGEAVGPAPFLAGQ